MNTVPSIEKMLKDVVTNYAIVKNEATVGFNGGKMNIPRLKTAQNNIIGLRAVLLSNGVTEKQFYDVILAPATAAAAC